MEDLEGKESKACDGYDWIFFWVWGRKDKLEDHIRYRGGGNGGLGKSSGDAFNGGAISAHSQVAVLDPLTPESLICKQGENKLWGTIHNNLTHSSCSYSNYGRSWRGGGGSQGQHQVVESNIDFYWFIGFFMIVGRPNFLSSLASPSLFLFWCFVLGQIFKGSNQSCEGTQFVVLDYGVRVLVP